jgi:hypothetical protein
MNHGPSWRRFLFNVGESINAMSGLAAVVAMQGSGLVYEKTSQISDV